MAGRALAVEAAAGARRSVPVLHSHPFERGRVREAGLVVEEVDELVRAQRPAEVNRVLRDHIRDQSRSGNFAQCVLHLLTHNTSADIGLN